MVTFAFGYRQNSNMREVVYLSMPESLKVNQTKILIVVCNIVVGKHNKGSIRERIRFH